jgi:phage-related protein
MPETRVHFYQESPGDVPVLDWLHELAHGDARALNKCRAAIERLKEMGHELRRPEADLLRDGIYELRVRVGRVNYRVLYFFHGQGVALLAHGLTKENEVPRGDIDKAVARKHRYEADPITHQYEENDDGD